MPQFLISRGRDNLSSRPRHTRGEGGGLISWDPGQQRLAVTVLGKAMSIPVIRKKPVGLFGHVCLLTTHQNHLGAYTHACVRTHTHTSTYTHAHVYVHFTWTNAHVFSCTYTEMSTPSSRPMKQDLWKWTDSWASTMLKSFPKRNKQVAA